MNRDQLVDRIRTLRQGIRAHRDQRGDDRCWVDDYRVWALLKGVSDLYTVPSDPLSRCRMFWANRYATEPDPTPEDAIVDPEQWDADLTTAGEGWLADEVQRLEAGIQAHHNVGGRPRSVDDDRALYALLPERIPADFRLPSEEDFLGEARAPDAGCPAFWRSHAKCLDTRHDLHSWGPCPQYAARGPCCDDHAANHSKLLGKLHGLYALVGGNPRHWHMLYDGMSPEMKRKLMVYLPEKCACHEAPNPPLFRKFYAEVVRRMRGAGARDLDAALQALEKQAQEFLKKEGVPVPPRRGPA